MIAKAQRSPFGRSLRCGPHGWVQHGPERSAFFNIPSFVFLRRPSVFNAAVRVGLATFPRSPALTAGLLASSNARQRTSGGKLVSAAMAALKLDFLMTFKASNPEWPYSTVIWLLQSTTEQMSRLVVLPFTASS
ncbi:MAG: hypothetical protein U5R30_02295 [Deltaproteobacteria bacterium]|nr:hypothetical protein [Deltaproteobacteria bacterium]